MSSQTIRKMKGSSTKFAFVSAIVHVRGFHLLIVDSSTQDRMISSLENSVVRTTSGVPIFSTYMLTEVSAIGVHEPA